MTDTESEKNNKEIEDRLVQELIAFAQKNALSPDVLISLITERLDVNQGVPGNTESPISHIVGTCLPGIDLTGFMELWTKGFHELEEFRIEKVGEELELKVKAPGLSAAVAITVKKPKE